MAVVASSFGVDGSFWSTLPAVEGPACPGAEEILGLESGSTFADPVAFGLRVAESLRAMMVFQS
jgi:hypothetical protein